MGERPALACMSVVTPRDALGYALSRELFALYCVVVLGYLAVALGAWVGLEWAWRCGGAGAVGQLLGLALSAAGFLAVLGAVVGLLYKVIADANAVGRSQSE